MSILKLFTMSETELVNLLKYHETRISEFRISNIFTLIDLFCKNCSFSDYDYSIAMTFNFKELIYHHLENNDIETSFLKTMNEITINTIEKTGSNRHVDFGETGKIVDSVTYEEIEGTPIQIGEHFYSSESANKIIENEDVFDPFTRKTLSSAEIDDISSKIFLSSIKAMNPHTSYTDEENDFFSDKDNNCAKKIIFETMTDETHDNTIFLSVEDKSQTTLNFTSMSHDIVQNFESSPNHGIRPTALFSQDQSQLDLFVTPRSSVREYRMNNNK